MVVTTVNKQVNQFWFDTVKGQKIETCVEADGTFWIARCRLCLASDEKLLPGTSIIVDFTKTIWTAELKNEFTLNETHSAQVSIIPLKKQKTIAEVAEEVKENALRENAKIRLPFRWAVGRKQGSINHILVLERYITVKLKRNKSDFLCSHKPRNGSNKPKEVEPYFENYKGNYLPEITCKTCLGMAERLYNKDGSIHTVESMSNYLNI